MVCSPARLAANRANSLKSTGPADTSRTRFNAVTHGLTAAVALPGEDQDALQATLDNLARDYRPQTEEELILVEDAAHLATRLRRCRRNVEALAAIRVRHAVEDFHKARHAAMNDAIDGLDRQPARAVALLKADPDGLDWLVEHWEELRRKLVASRGGTLRTQGADDFEVTDVATMVRLTGREFGVDKPREAKLHEAFGGYFVNLDMADRDAVPDDAKIEWARGVLLEMIDRELAEVRQIRDAFDLTDLRLDQDEAEDRALFDPSKEAILARRYEAATRRDLKRTFRDLKELAAMRAEQPPAAPEPLDNSEFASKGRGSLASFCKIEEPAIVARGSGPFSTSEGPPQSERTAPTRDRAAQTDPIPSRIE